ncbi:MAG: ABC transporter ATP-binding protein [Culicoidibacterales bacterium]
MNVIEMVELTKTYQHKVAIDQINLVVEEGDFYGFIGPNGAGKSTTIKCLLNFIFPTAGSAHIFGVDTQTKSAQIKKDVSYIASDVRLYEEMTTRQLVKLTLDFHQKKHMVKTMNYYFDLFEIDPDKRISDLSLGNKRKASIISGLITEPKLLILDEPTNGLDPLMQHRLFDLLNEKNKAGMTIFLSSHDLSEIQNNCNRAAFIKAGKIIFEEDILLNDATGKIIEVTGPNIPLEKLVAIGAILLSGNHLHARLLYLGDIKLFLPKLVDAGITDLTITRQQLEDKFISLYER